MRKLLVLVALVLAARRPGGDPLTSLHIAVWPQGAEGAPHTLDASLRARAGDAPASRAAPASGSLGSRAVRADAERHGLHDDLRRPADGARHGHVPRPQVWPTFNRAQRLRGRPLEPGRLPPALTRPP